MLQGLKLCCVACKTKASSYPCSVFCLISEPAKTPVDVDTHTYDFSRVPSQPLYPQEHVAEVYVRTRHSPLHWVSSQVQTLGDGPPQHQRYVPISHALEEHEHYFHEGEQEQQQTVICEQGQYSPSGEEEQESFPGGNHRSNGGVIEETSEGEFSGAGGGKMDGYGGDFTEQQHPQHPTEYDETITNEPQYLSCIREQQQLHQQGLE